MKLSIVTINYNDAVGLKRTLDSVASQSLAHNRQQSPTIAASPIELEHIIIDGASTDGSVDVIRQYELSLANNRPSSPTIASSPIIVRWISERDKGIYDAMNKGVKMAIEGRADYIQILNSGDCLYSDSVITDMYKAIGERREAKGEWPGIVYGNMIRDYGDRRKAKGDRRDKCMGQHEWTMLDFIKGTINHDPTWIRRDLYEKYGLYDPELKICSDWKWFVNAVVFGGEKPVYVPIDVTLFDVTGISETQLEFRESERESELRKMLPETILKDYWTWHFPIEQIKRLKRYHVWPVIYFIERVFFKLEKWGILSK